MVYSIFASRRARTTHGGRAADCTDSASTRIVPPLQQRDALLAEIPYQQLPAFRIGTNEVSDSRTANTNTKILSIG